MGYGQVNVGGSTNKDLEFTTAVLQNSKGGYTITTDRDYDIIVISNASSGKRGQGAGGSATIDSYTAISVQSNGNYGYNSNLGKDNDQAGIQYIFNNVKSGATIIVNASPGFFTSICVGLYRV